MKKLFGWVVVAAMLLAACDSVPVDSERLQAFAELEATPLWRVQLAMKVCDRSSAGSDRVWFANGDDRFPTAWAPAPKGVGLNMPEYPLRRDRIGVFDLAIDGNAGYGTIDDVEQIVLTAAAESSLCLDWVSLLINNPHPIEVEGGAITGAAADYVVFTRRWPGGNWLRATLPRLVFDPCLTLWVNTDLDETDPGRRRVPGAAMPPGFEARGNAHQPELRRLKQAGVLECFEGTSSVPTRQRFFPAAAGLSGFRLATRTEIRASEEWSSAVANRSRFNNLTGAIRLRPVLRDFMAGVIGDLIINETLDRVEWGERRGDDWVTFRPIDGSLDTIRVDLDLNRKGRNQTAWNRLDVDFDLVVGCDGTNMRFTPQNVSVDFTTFARVGSIGIFKGIERIAERLASENLRPVSLPTPTCGNPRFQGGFLWLV